MAVQQSLRSYAWNQVKQPMEDLYLLSTEISMMQEIIEVCSLLTNTHNVVLTVIIGL